MGIVAGDSGAKIAKAVFVSHPTVSFYEKLHHFCPEQAAKRWSTREIELHHFFKLGAMAWL